MKKYTLLTVLTLLSVGALAANEDFTGSSARPSLLGIREALGVPTPEEAMREVLLNNPLRILPGLRLVELLPNINDLVGGLVPNSNDLHLVMRGEE